MSYDVLLAVIDEEIVKEEEKLPSIESKHNPYTWALIEGKLSGLYLARRSALELANLERAPDVSLS